jgi:hypothetical protein
MSGRTARRGLVRAGAGGLGPLLLLEQLLEPLDLGHEVALLRDQLLDEIQ